MNETNALPHVSPMPDGPIDGPAAWLVSKSAMCGRPPVVKGFLNVDARAGRSCHVFGLFVRPCSMAAGHNALRGLGSGHKHALKGRSGTIGLSRSVGRLAWVRYSFIALSNFVGGSSPPVRVAALYRGQPRWLKLFASRHHGPGDAGDLVGQGDGGDLETFRLDRRPRRSCWIAGPGARPARDGAYSPPAWRAGSPTRHR